jgi:hypothetical protein
MSSTHQARILVCYADGRSNALFLEKARDNCTEPYRRLRQSWIDLGFSVEEVSESALEDCALLLFWDPTSIRRGIRGLIRSILRGPRPNWLRKAKRAGISDRTALIAFEPPAVCISNADLTLYDEFPVVLTWNDAVVDGSHIVKYCLPVPEQYPSPSLVPFSKKKLLANISYNKYSSVPGELYSARREAIEYFEQHYPEHFDLFGVGWRGAQDSPQHASGRGARHPSYRGTVGNKWEVLPWYKFSLCYENSRDQPGCVTEKIFDCLRSDCMPIYWGAPNITEYVDDDVFIDRRKFGSTEELASFIVSLSEGEYEVWRGAVARYLASERFRQFLSSAFVRTVNNALGIANRSAADSASTLATAAWPAGPAPARNLEDDLS